MRPAFDYRPRRIQAHVTISVIALLAERVAEIPTGETWRNLADQLDRIKVVEYGHNGARIRQTSEIYRDLAALLAKLGVSASPKLHASRTCLWSSNTTRTAESSLSWRDDREKYAQSGFGSFKTGREYDHGTQARSACRRTSQVEVPDTVALTGTYKLYVARAPKPRRERREVRLASSSCPDSLVYRSLDMC